MEKKLYFLWTLMLLPTSVGGMLTKVTIKGCWSLLGSGFIESSNIFTPFTVLLPWMFTFQSWKSCMFDLWLHLFILVLWPWCRWYVIPPPSTFTSLACKGTFTTFSPWNASINLYKQGKWVFKKNDSYQKEVWFPIPLW